MKSTGDILSSRKPRPRQPDSFEGLPIRSSKRKTRLYLDNEYYKLGYAALLPHSATIIYNIIAMHANHRTQTCFPSVQRIMELGDIKNRRTLFDGIRMLEAFGIIAVEHSKGRTSNIYALLDVSAWETPNSGTIDTVRNTRKSKSTISIDTAQPSQNQPINSSSSETRNHLMDSSKEIGTENKKTENTEPIKRGISKDILIMFSPYCEEVDTLAAYSELQGNGNEKPSYTALKVLLKQWVREGKIKEKKPMW